MVQVHGRDRAKGKISQLQGAEMVAEVDKALFKGGNLIQTTAQKSITDGSISGKGHIPSKPGEPPNADTHTLDRQIETAATGPLQVEVSSNAPYSAHLEYGTSRMAARPYMGPAARKERANVVRLVTEAAKRAVGVTFTGGGNGNAR